VHRYDVMDQDRTDNSPWLPVAYQLMGHLSSEQG
jgi:hypothetical protein